MQLAPSQSIVQLAEEGRLLGGEGFARVVVTLDQTTADATLAETVVPVLGMVETLPCSFDAVSHVSLPLHIGGDCSAMDGLLQDANASVAVISNLEQLLRETRDPERPAGPKKQWTWKQVSHASSGKIDLTEKLKGLRTLNEASVQRALRVLREAIGPSLVESFVRDKLERLEAHHKELKTVRRRNLDNFRATYILESKSIPADRKAILRLEQQEVECLADARKRLRDIESGMERLVVNSNDELAALEKKIAEQKTLYSELEKELAEVEAATQEHGRTRGFVSKVEDPSGRRIALRKQLSELKQALSEEHEERTQLQKRTVDGPRKDLEEQQNRIVMIEKEQQRSLEIVRKRRKKLDERFKEMNQTIAEVDAKRLTVDVEVCLPGR